MTTQTLPLLTTRIRQDDGDDESTLARQWRLLKLLTFAKGIHDQGIGGGFGHERKDGETRFGLPERSWVRRVGNGARSWAIVVATFPRPKGGSGFPARVFAIVP